jgi:hypothetical protein
LKKLIVELEMVIWWGIKKIDTIDSSLYVSEEENN